MRISWKVTHSIFGKIFLDRNHHYGVMNVLNIWQFMESQNNIIDMRKNLYNYENNSYYFLCYTSQAAWVQVYKGNMLFKYLHHFDLLYLFIYFWSQHCTKLNIFWGKFVSTVSKLLLLLYLVFRIMRNCLPCFGRGEPPPTPPPLPPRQPPDPPDPPGPLQKPPQQPLHHQQQQQQLSSQSSLTLSLLRLLGMLISTSLDHLPRNYPRVHGTKQLQVLLRLNALNLTIWQHKYQSYRSHMVRKLLG